MVTGINYYGYKDKLLMVPLCNKIDKKSKN